MSGEEGGGKKRCRQGGAAARIQRRFQGVRPMGLPKTVLELRACRPQERENAFGQAGEEEEEADQEEVGGVWLVGSVDEVRDGWRRSEATDAVRLMQTETDTVNKSGADQENGCM